MATNRRAAGGQQACPEFTIRGDITDGDKVVFKNGTKLTAWTQRYAYYRTLVPEAKVSDERLKELILKYPEDTDDADTAIVEVLEASADPEEDVKDLAEPLSAVMEAGDLASYYKLGAMLSEHSDFDEHADKLVGVGKELFDGSLMEIAEDIEKVNTKTGGEFFVKRSALLPGSYPIGHTNREQVPHPKALPFGSNDISDRFPVAKGGRTVYESRVGAIVKGTNYGRKLVYLSETCKRIVQAASEGQSDTKPEPLSAAEAKVFLDRLTEVFPKQDKFNISRIADVENMNERLNKRMTNTVTKFGGAWKFCRQKRKADAVNDHPAIDGEFKWFWRSKDKELRHASTAPLSVKYEYPEEGAETDTISVIGKLSIGTFCRWDFDKALRAHKSGTDFIADLKETVKREPTEKAKEKRIVNLDAPSEKDVNDMMASLGKYFANPANDQLFWEYTHNDDTGMANRELLSRLTAHVTRQFSRHKADIERDNREKDRQRAELEKQKQKEDQAMAAEGRERTAA